MNIIESFKCLLEWRRNIVHYYFISIWENAALADGGRLVISVSVRSQLRFSPALGCEVMFPKWAEDYTVLLKRSFSFEYNFKKIFKGTNLKPQIRAQH
jgi:hypothetical protein